MLSVRSLRRRKNTSRNSHTTSGINEYYVDPHDLTRLAALFEKATHRGMRRFLISTLTQKELSEITRRMLIAKLLMDGKTYEEIGKQLHAAKGTISLVRQALDSQDGILKSTVSDIYGIKIIDPAESYFRNRLKKGK